MKMSKMRTSANIFTEPWLIMTRPRIYVFDTDQSGRHLSPAAKIAVQEFGAKRGQASGLQGFSYGIPVKDYSGNKRLDIYTLIAYINKFIECVNKNPEADFFLMEVGCNYIGKKPSEVAPLFEDIFGADNVVFPKSFIDEYI